MSLFGFGKKSPEQSSEMGDADLAALKADRDNLKMMMNQESHPDDAARLEALEKKIAELEK